MPRTVHKNNKPKGTKASLCKIKYGVPTSGLIKGFHSPCSPTTTNSWVAMKSRRFITPIKTRSHANLRYRLCFSSKRITPRMSFS